MLYVLVTIASLRQFQWVHSKYHNFTKDQRDILKSSLLASWPGAMINPQWLKLPIDVWMNGNQYRLCSIWSRFTPSRHKRVTQCHINVNALSWYLYNITSTLMHCHEVCIKYKNFYKIYLLRHPAVGNRPVQRVEVEESTEHKWVN